MKKIYFLLLIFISNFAFSQMDTEHWFAPMKRQADNDNRMMGLYLSTNQATPFYVKIENNKKIIDSIMISKNNPAHYTIRNLEIMETNRTDSLRIPISKGLHVYGAKKFFANLRFSQSNHAEIITSKGRAALGTHFFIAYAPFSNGDRNTNFSIGIIATEDNTTVTLNGTTFTLNRGKSYLLEGRDDALIGKEITSDKPITVTNGNYNGQYASTSTSAGTDILMDQTVPTERLGKEFILMSGNGNFTDGMESAIIVATADNTSVFFNGDTAATITLSKGQYFLMPTGKYRRINATSSTAYIKTSENVYVFQLLSGSGTLASGGFNYIPPLNCYLPKNIDEIGFINENPGYLYGSANAVTTHRTKLNIISKAGATVKLNGTVLNGTFGPNAVAGTTEWTTYTVPDVKGTAVIESTAAVTAGIAAGDDAVGYGGYFAGASSIPVITKSGACLPGISLEVEDTFDNYQWKIKIPATGNYDDIPGATSFKYTPTIPGEYICEIGTETCGKLTTPSYTVLNCTKNSTASYTICQPKTITPAFAASTQAINPAKTKKILEPAKGTAIISGGQITYTPFSGFANNTTDSFSYYIEGNSLYPDSEIVTVNIILKKQNAQNAELAGCLINGVTLYNLTEANVTSDANVIINYYENLTDATANNVSAAISNPNAYSTALTKVYGNITSEFGCATTAEISLKNFPVPNIDTSKYNATRCDDNLDGKITVKFSNITPLIVQNSSDFNVIYTVAGNVLPDNYEFNSDTTVNVEVKSKNGCPSAFGVINFKFGEKISLNTINPIEVCDNDLDGTANINLSDYSGMISNAPATFYAKLQDAKDKTNTISAGQNITGDKDFYLRFEDAAYCPDVATLRFKFKKPKKSDMAASVTICKDATTNLDAGSGFDTYLWSTGATTENSGQLPVGRYWMDLGSNGCVYRQNVDIVAAQDPIISEIKTTGKNIKITVTGGTPPYQYSLDQINWQTSNEFLNLKTGRQRVFVKDNLACSIVSKEFLILNLVNAISPNGDGINDTLDYSDLSLKKDVQMEIYDRYGKMMYRATDKFIWDGTAAGRAVPTGTYWYMLKWTEPDSGEAMQYSGWILVKNY